VFMDGDEGLGSSCGGRGEERFCGGSIRSSSLSWSGFASPMPDGSLAERMRKKPAKGTTGPPVRPAHPGVHGRTALTLAAGQGHGVIVDLLLAGGAWADPHEDYDTYETPLMAAVIGGHLEIVKKLVGAGANPSFCVGVGQRTAEAYARSHGHTEIARYLAEQLSK